MALAETEGLRDPVCAGARVRLRLTFPRLLGVLLVVLGLVEAAPARTAAAHGSALAVTVSAAIPDDEHGGACTHTVAHGSPACPSFHGSHGCLAETSPIEAPVPLLAAEGWRTGLPWRSRMHAPDPPPPQI